VQITRAGFNSSEQTIEVNDTSVEQTFEIERHRVNVDFTVRDNHFEQPRPLEGATVEIEGVGSPIPTDENGETEARIPVNDNYQVTVLLDGYQETTTTLRLRQQSTSLDLTTQRTPSISINQLQNAIVVGQPTQVTIANAYEEPVEGATVSLNDEEVGQTAGMEPIEAGTEVAHAGNDQSIGPVRLGGIELRRASSPVE
jgi:hypothetical protein